MKKNEMTNATVATKNETKKAATKKVEKKTVKKVEQKAETKNEEKKNVILAASDINAMYAEAGIKTYNPDAKGRYRIMGSKKGSSLNWGKEFTIYSTQADFDAIRNQAIEGVQTVESGNAKDKVRPHTVIIKTVDALKAALAVYATNPLNQPVTVPAGA